MAKKPDTEAVEAEATPLAVVTREPSDEELIAEIGALCSITRRYAKQRQEYHHAATGLEEAIVWLRAAQAANVAQQAQG